MLQNICLFSSVCNVYIHIAQNDSRPQTRYPMTPHLDPSTGAPASGLLGAQQAAQEERCRMKLPLAVRRQRQHPC